nr:IBR domain, zinc finger, RING/FYVE/PHD-type, E3 ubiquitin ligase RBR family [Tanacetum cinerariifolium]
MVPWNDGGYTCKETRDGNNVDFDVVCERNEWKWKRCPKFSPSINTMVMPLRKAESWNGVEHTDRSTRPDRTGTNVFRSGPRSGILDQFGLRNQARAAQNRQNRAKSTVVCRQGSRSLVRLRDHMSSSTREYPSLIHSFFVTHTVGEVFVRDEDRALYKEMLRLQRLGSNTETSVPYTEEEIMAIVRKGKQRGHLPGVGRVNMMMRLFKSDNKFSWMLDQFESSPEFGGPSGSDGCGDDEPGGDEDDDEDEEDGLVSPATSRPGKPKNVAGIVINSGEDEIEDQEECEVELDSTHESGSGIGCGAGKNDESDDDEDVGEDADS